MCGGGGNTVTQTQTQTPPRYLRQAQQQAVGAAQQAASAPFAQPVAPVAPFTPLQSQAHQQVAAMQGMTDPYYEAAKAQLGAAGTEITQDDIEKYLNPYRNEVLANMQKYIFGPQRVQTMGQARARAGGPGADRLALTSQNLDFTQADALSQALAGFYNPAMQQAQRSKEMALQTGLGWGNLGTSAQNAALQATGALGTAGAQQQALTQAQQTAEYQQELARLAYPFQTASYLAGTAAQVAPGAGGTTQGTTTYPTPSPLNQIVGAGTSALGAYMGMPGGGTGKGSGVPNYGQSYNIGYGGQMMPVFGMPSNRGGRIGYAHGGRAGFAKGGSADNFTNNLTSGPSGGVAPPAPAPTGPSHPGQPNQPSWPNFQGSQNWFGNSGNWREMVDNLRNNNWGAPEPGQMPSLPTGYPGSSDQNNPFQMLSQIASMGKPNGFAEGGEVEDDFSVVPDMSKVSPVATQFPALPPPPAGGGGGSSGGGKGSTAGGSTAGGSGGGNETQKWIQLGLQAAQIAAMAFSDRRVKNDVREIGKTHDGQKIYRFRYNNDPSRAVHLGLMAQDVEKRHPEAVGEVGGIKAVDYDRATSGSSPSFGWAGGGTVNPFDAGQGFQEGGEIDDFSSRWSALTPPEQDPPTTFPDRWNAAVEAEKEGTFQPQGGQTPPLRTLGLKAALPPQETPPVAPPVERPQVAVNPGPRPIPPRLPRDPSVDLESLILPRDRMPYPDATERDWGQRMVRSPWAALIPAGAKIAQTVGPLGSAIGAGIGAGFGELGAQRKELRSEEAINQRAQELYRRAQSELRDYQKSRFQQMPYTTGEGHPLAFDPSIGRARNVITGEPIGPGDQLSPKVTGSGRPSIFEQKRKAWLALNPGDERGALNYANGRTTMSNAQIANLAFMRAQAAMNAYRQTPDGLMASPEDLERYQEKKREEYLRWYKEHNTMDSGRAVEPE